MIDLFDGRPTYLFACNENSEQLSKSIRIDGFIDDFRKGSFFADRPVIDDDSIPADAVVVNCTLASKGRLARSRIESLPCFTACDYSEILREHPTLIPVPAFIQETLRDIEENASEWSRLRIRLHDDQSRKVLDDLIEFRTTARLDALADYAFAPEMQYFDEVVTFADEEVFVDCGGFDGDTTAEFIKRNPGYKHIYLFEPSPPNLAKARSRLARFSNIEFIPKGVSDTPATASFDASAGSASAISEDGPDRIVLTTIDDTVTAPLTFIKMDLEGWELKALDGAANHIRDDHPKLAIAVYHHPSDFWRIPALILDIRDDYDVHLRHYTEGWTETVMYFVPRKSTQH